MVQKAEIIVEQFDNGISLVWSDISGELGQSKKVASIEDKEMAIGKEIWDDIESFFEDTLKDKVKIEINYKEV